MGKPRICWEVNVITFTQAEILLFKFDFVILLYVVITFVVFHITRNQTENSADADKPRDGFRSQ